MFAAIEMMTFSSFLKLPLEVPIFNIYRIVIIKSLTLVPEEDTTAVREINVPYESVPVTIYCKWMEPR
jgi:hypothetical protein